MTTKWTKFSERLPEGSVSEVFVQWHKSGVHVEQRGSGSWSHWYRRAFQQQAVAWHPITYPEVPPHDETQDEKDRLYFEEWNMGCQSYIRDSGVIERLARLNGFKAALRYERAEVAKELMHISNLPAGVDYAPHMDAVTRLRKRVGLDK